MKGGGYMAYQGVHCRIYPNDLQMDSIRRTIGHSRFVWNQMLDMLVERYRNNPNLTFPSAYTLQLLLKPLKQEYPWLKEADSTALQDSVKQLVDAYQRFFKGIVRHPKHKSRKFGRQSYYSSIRGNNIRLNQNERYIKLPKLGWAKCKLGIRHLEDARIQGVTVTETPSGKFIASILVKSEGDNQALPKTGQSIGIDLGVSDLAILSDGTRVKSQRLHLKYQRELHYWEARMARRRRRAKAAGIDLQEARNYQRAKQHVARIHERIRHVRKDYLDKFTTNLVKRFDAIAIEDLKTKNLQKNKHLARSISAQSWRMLRTMLEYKCARYDKSLIVVDPYKTSQWCSDCGADGGRKPLDVRAWQCVCCHAVHDRDVNAAKNILNIGLERALVI